MIRQIQDRKILQRLLNAVVWMHLPVPENAKPSADTNQKIVLEKCHLTALG